MNDMTHPLTEQKSIFWGKTFCSLVASGDKTECFRVINNFTDDEWKSFHQYVSSYNASCLVFDAICNNKDELKVPQNIINALRSTYLKASSEYLKRNDLLKIILKKFDDKKIDIMILKGAYFAEKLHKNPALRVMNDFDFLVRVKDLKRAVEVFLELGYDNPLKRIGVDENYCYQHIPTFKGKDKYPVDLHFTLNFESCPHNFHSMDVEDLWKYSTPSHFYGYPCYEFKPELMFLSMLIACSTGFYRQKLVSIIDMKLFLEKNKLDWSVFKSLIKKLEIEKQAFVTLWFLKKYFYCNGIDEKLFMELGSLVIPEAVERSIEYFLFGSLQEAFFDSAKISDLASQDGFYKKIRHLFRKLVCYRDLELAYPLSINPKILYLYLIRSCLIIKRSLRYVVFYFIHEREKKPAKAYNFSFYKWLKKNS